MTDRITPGEYAHHTTDVEKNAGIDAKTIPMLELGGVRIYAHRGIDDDAIVVWIDTTFEPDKTGGTNLRVNVNDGGIFGYDE